MEIPKDVLEKHGTTGESIYKKGHKDGKLEGAKVAKSPFATEVNSFVGSILKGKDKEGYKAPDTKEIGKLFSSVFKFDGEPPDRNALKRLAITTLKCIEGMEIPPKKATEKPPTPKAN